LIITKDYVDQFAEEFNNILVQYASGNGQRTSHARQYYLSCASLNEDFAYREWAATEGVGFPRTRMNVLNRSRKDGTGITGGAPMLQNNYTLEWMDFLGVMIVLPPANIPIGSGTFMPDVTMVVDHSSQLDAFQRVYIHELGHTAHYEAAGADYWNGYRRHILNNVTSLNGNYGSFNDWAILGSDPEKVALSEAWGDFVATANYRNRDDMPNFSPVGSDGDYIPQDLFSDLVDFGVQDVIDDPFAAGGGVLDQVEGYTAADIWSAVSSNGNRSIQDFKVTLLQGGIPGAVNGSLLQIEDLIDEADVLD
jgi:hypothetical protein